MTAAGCLFMFAGDHRWQWEKWVDEHGLGRDAIAAVKRLFLPAFLQAARMSADVRTQGALLLDEQYAAGPIREAMELGLLVATPAERAGAVPIEWNGEFDRMLTGLMVKVLVVHRRATEALSMAEQFRKILEVQAWCRGHARPLLVELLIPEEPGDPEDFDEHIRPELIAHDISTVYALGLVPEFWKLEGTSSESGAEVIDAAVALADGPRYVVLGKAAELATIARWFRAARRTSTAAGFAIGRSLFWQPGTRVLLGQMSPADAVGAIAENYLQAVNLWNAAGVPARQTVDQWQQ